MGSEMKKYLDSTGRFPEDALLGYIAFTTGADAEHDRDKLLLEFEQRGLNKDFVPPLSRAVDAYKKAIKNAQEYKYPITRTTEARVLFREVDSPNSEEVSLRVIMREERDDAKSRLAYDKVGEVKLYRGPRRKGVVDDSGARFSWNLAANVTDAEREYLTLLGGIVRGDYERYRSTLEGQRIRDMILQFMKKELQSVPLKTAVHFVPIQQAETLHAFAQVIGTLDGCKIDLVPLVDLVDQRDQVLAALQADTERMLGELVADLDKARAGRTTPKTYAALRARYDAVMARSQQYADLLDTSVDRTTGATDVAKSMLAHLSRQFLVSKESA